MKYLGNNQYLIENKTTGEKRAVASDQLANYGIQIPQANTPPAPAPPQKDIAGTGLLPAAGGIAGMIGGTALGGYPVGSMAGGAAGQGLGEIIKELINQHSLNLGEVGRQAGEGALYGAIPESEGGIVARITKRSLAGAGIGAGVQAVEETGKTGTPAERTGRVAKQAGVGAASMSVLGGAGDIFSSLSKFVGERIPADIIDMAKTKPAEFLQGIYKKVQGDFVGHNNVEYAVSNGIIPKESGLTTDVINQSLDRGRVRAKEVEGKLQDALANQGKVPYSEVSPLIDHVFTTLPNYNQANQMARRLYDIAEKDIGVPVAAERAGKTIKMFQGVKEISLSAVNEMKRALGEAYGKTGIAELYNHFQSYIENASNLPEEVRALNQEAGKLVHINANIKEWLGKATALPKALTPEGIKSAFNKEAMKNPQSLKAAIKAIALVGMVGVGGALKGTVGALIGGGIAFTFGLRGTLDAMIEASSKLNTPESRLILADQMARLYTSAKNFSEKSQIEKAMEQMGMRTFSSFFEGKTNKNTSPNKK